MDGDRPDRSPRSDTEPHALDGRRIVLGVTGSIAAYKAAELTRLLKKAGAEVQVLMTRDATRFISPLTLGTLSEGDVPIEIFPENEDGSWTKHVELGLWADLIVVAPASATTLSRLATGVCDSMLTAVALSRNCPMLVCPAMDRDMLANPATQRNLDTLAGDGVLILPPEHGELASGLIGDGRLPEPETIVDHIAGLLLDDGALAGKSVVVTAGPTREELDPVRFLSNGSTGTMGFALAGAAARRGAEVTLVAGPTDLPTPLRVTRIDVTSAREMYEATMQHAAADVVIGAAAVSDYRPLEASERKMKKGEDDLVLELTRNPDIIAAVGSQKRMDQIVVGFALETHDGLENAKRKLGQKRLDLVVLNHANEPGSGFGAGTNRVTLIDSNGNHEDLPPLPKGDVADHILDHIQRITR